MKSFWLILGAIATTSVVLGFSKIVYADIAFGCTANPKIGDECTQRVTIRLRKVESTGRDSYDQRFEPRPGWAIQDCDTRGGERGRTGEVSGPICNIVQKGNISTSSEYIGTKSKEVYEIINKLKVSGSLGIVQASNELETRARSEFSNLEQTASTHRTDNAGSQIRAWVAVRGGCRTRLPFGGSCVNWGPGGSLDTDIIIRLIYVGTNQDIDQIAAKYIQRAQNLASKTPSQPSLDNNLALVQSWGLTATSCNNSGVVSISIDNKQYCAFPTDWLSAGKYVYDRSTDNLEPLNSNPDYTPNSPTNSPQQTDPSANSGGGFE